MCRKKNDNSVFRSNPDEGSPGSGSHVPERSDGRIPRIRMRPTSGAAIAHDNITFQSIRLTVIDIISTVFVRHDVGLAKNKNNYCSRAPGVRPP